MDTELVRYRHGAQSIGGLFFIDKVFQCHILENPWLENKSMVSCIPTGTYKLELRTEGGWHERATKKFGKAHKGMIEVTKVKGRSFILMHWGNKPVDTHGCLLTGTTCHPDFVGASVAAYEPAYEKIAGRLLNDELVNLTVRNI